MSKPFSCRMPDNIATWIDAEAQGKGMSMSQFVINTLRSVMQDGQVDVRQMALPVSYSDVIQTSDRVSDTLSDSIDKLTAAVEASTQQQADLAAQLSQLQLAPRIEPEEPVADQGSTMFTPPETTSAKATPSPKTKAKAKKSTKKAAKKDKSKNAKGGRPGPTYLYNGVEATIREHLETALPNLSKKQIAQSRNNINRMIKGRSDQPQTKTKTPQEAISYEIERLRDKL